jgi:predicted HAD superfamily Cof-like phosphohydrolase
MTGVTIQGVLIQVREQFRKYAASHNQKAMDAAARAERYEGSTNPELVNGAQTFREQEREAQAKADTNTGFADLIDAVVIQARDHVTTEADRAVALNILTNADGMPETAEGVTWLADRIAKYRHENNITDGVLRLQADTAASLMLDMQADLMALRNHVAEAIKLLEAGLESNAAIAGDLKAAILTIAQAPGGNLIEGDGEIKDAETIANEGKEAWRKFAESRAAEVRSINVTLDAETTSPVTPEQEEEWRKVIDTVTAAGGKASVVVSDSKTGARWAYGASPEPTGDTFTAIGDTQPVKTVLDMAHGEINLPGGITLNRLVEMSGATEMVLMPGIAGALGAKVPAGMKFGLAAALDGVTFTATEEPPRQFSLKADQTRLVSVKDGIITWTDGDGFHGIEHALADVIEWHSAFQPDWLSGGTIQPLSMEEGEIRAAWIESEARELKDDTYNAVLRRRDQLSTVHDVSDLSYNETIGLMAKQVDAAMDAVYFALGIPMRMGLNPGPFWRIVHGQNMAKMHTDEHGAKHVVRRESDGKVVKPEGWVDPHELIVAEIKRQMAVQSNG